MAVSAPFFRLRLLTVINKVFPGMHAPPWERQVDMHKPVLCGYLRSVDKVYCGGQKIKVLFIYSEGEFSKIIAFKWAIIKILNI
jgi:hypothetical protein